MMRFGMGLGLSKGRALRFDGDASAFIDAAGITNEAQRKIVNTLTVGLKENTLWTPQKAIYPIIGGTATSHSFNLKNPAQYQITWNGTVLHNASGIQPDGLTGYGDTGLIASSIANNNVHLSTYINIQGEIGEFLHAIAIGAFQNGVGLMLIEGPDYGDAYNTFERINFTEAGGPLNPVPGFLMATRTTIAFAELRNATTQVGTDVTENTLANPSLSIFIGANNFNGSAASFGNVGFGFASIGSGMTSAQSDAYFVIIQAFQTALGRQV